MTIGTQFGTMGSSYTTGVSANATQLADAISTAAAGATGSGGAATGLASVLTLVANLGVEKKAMDTAYLEGDNQRRMP